MCFLSGLTTGQETPGRGQPLLGPDSSHTNPCGPQGPASVSTAPDGRCQDGLGGGGLCFAEVVNWDPFHLTGEKSEQEQGSQVSVKLAPSLNCLLSLGLSQSHSVPKEEEANEPSHALWPGN